MSFHSLSVQYNDSNKEVDYNSYPLGISSIFCWSTIFKPFSCLLLYDTIFFHFSVPPAKISTKIHLKLLTHLHQPSSLLLFLHSLQAVILTSLPNPGIAECKLRAPGLIQVEETFWLSHTGVSTVCSYHHFKMNGFYMKIDI